MADLDSMKLRLIFHSIHNVMLAEDLLLKIGVPLDMIPVPREVSSDCGMCLACNRKDLEKIKAALEREPFTSSIMIYENNPGERTPGSKLKLLLTIP